MEEKVWVRSSSGNVVVYGMDAGGKNNMAWVRLDGCPGELDNYIPSVEPNRIIDPKNGHAFEAGTDLATLADRIVHDLQAGKLIAFGVEAPMWIPISPQHGDYRFDEEKGSSWSGLLGSTVSLLGVKQAVHLFDLIDKRDVRILSTTDVDQWKRGASNLLLYEGFISGKYKLDCVGKPEIRDKSEYPREGNLWDAFLVACAFRGKYLNCSLGSTYQAIRFQVRYSHVLSHWHSIMKRFGMSIFPSGDKACAVLAIEK